MTSAAMADAVTLSAQPDYVKSMFIGIAKMVMRICGYFLPAQLAVIGPGDFTGIHCPFKCGAGQNARSKFLISAVFVAAPLLFALRRSTIVFGNSFPVVGSPAAHVKFEVSSCIHRVYIVAKG